MHDLSGGEARTVCGLSVHVEAIGDGKEVDCMACIAPDAAAAPVTIVTR